MSKTIASICATLIAASTPANTADWRNVGLDLEVDLQSVKVQGTGFVAALRHTDLASEGLPPPARSALQHYRIDCAGDTYSAFDVTYYDAKGKTLPGSGPYPDVGKQTFKTNSGGMPARIEAMVCPTLHSR